MLLRKETTRSNRSSTEVLTTSWMRDSDPQNTSINSSTEEYGWLACGNRSGVVSITLTSLQSDVNALYQRTNFNLCDHKNPVHIVEWNPVYRKLATCSALGAILVYQKSDDRWTVDLVNDRPHQVEEFRWSRSGDRVMIVYSDGLLVVGSVHGQRLWHRMMELRGAGPIPRRHPHQQPGLHQLGWQHQVGQLGAATPGVGSSGQDASPQAASTEEEDSQPRQDEMPTLTCGTWSPKDKTITVATSHGYLLSFPASWERLPSRRVRQTDHLLRYKDSIVQLEWSCPRFSATSPPPTTTTNGETPAGPPADNAQTTVANLDLGSGPGSGVEAERGEAGAAAAPTEAEVQEHPEDENLDDYEEHRLAVAFFSGFVYLLRSPDDPDPVVIETRLWRLRVAWNSTGSLLAVAGFVRSANLQCQCSVRLYNTLGELVYGLPVDSLSKPIMSLSWAHNDRRLFVAASHYVHTLCLEEEVPRLTMLAALGIEERLNSRPEKVDKLPLPAPLKGLVQVAFHHTIQSCMPQATRLREFVVLPRQERLFCTVVRHDQNEFATHYTLYLEFLGGLVPLLRAKRVGKIKPDFIIYDPKIRHLKDKDELFPISSDEEASSGSSTEEEASQMDAGCGSPRARRRRWKRRQKYGRNEDAESKPDDVVFYNQNLPEVHKLVAVHANVWGTRFQLLGLQPFLPASLGEVSYKKSVLHLQPREMTVKVTELTPDMHHKLVERRQRRRLSLTKTWQDPGVIVPPVDADSPLISRDSSGLEESEFEERRRRPEDAQSQSSTLASVKNLLLNISDLLYIDDNEEGTGADGETTPLHKDQAEDSHVWQGHGLVTSPILAEQKIEVTPPCSPGLLGESVIERSLTTHAVDLLSTPVHRPNTRSGPRRHFSPASVINKTVSRVRRCDILTGSAGGGGTEVLVGGVASRSAPATPVRLARCKKCQIDELVVTSSALLRQSGGGGGGGGPGRFLRHSGSLEKEEALLLGRRHKYKKGARIGDAASSCGSSPDTDCFRTFIMNNKKPNWNEENQVYQLDFGGRVTQESAKNFQIEQDSKQVLQFGRLNGNTFALDFQYPFSPIQAFGVALANVTTRFK